MGGCGRINTNPATSSILEDRRLHREYYSTIHKVQVKDLHLEEGTVGVVFLDGGDPRTIPIPLIGFSAPTQEGDTDKNYLRFSWGVYCPQLDDVILVAFDTKGKAHALGYSTVDFRVMKRLDDSTEDRGGIGWGDASGKRLRPGDWSFKSARGCAFYMGDRISLTAGSHSITLDKPRNEVTLQSDLIHQRYGGASESRSGSVKRLLTPVDTSEMPVYDVMFGSVAQEHTHYVKRATIPFPAGQIMVRTSEGEVVDDLTAQIVPPATFSPDLAVALTGTGVRILREVMDDASGMVPMWMEMTDNLGNWGVSAKTAVGLQWFTPASTWTVLNTMVNWKTTTTYALDVGIDYSLKVGGKMDFTVAGAWSATAGATMDLTAAAAMTLKAASIALAAPSISLGASPCVMSCVGGPLTLDSPLMLLGIGASEPLIKGTTFNAALAAYLAASSTAFTALAAIPVFLPGTAQFTALAAAATALAAALSGSLSTKSMTL
jgi:hypothetical protein